MTPISRWLRETRLRQTNPDTGRPWSQDYLVERVSEETGWRLYGSNYIAYETGRQTPKPETLQRFVDFWAARGEPGPDMTPEVPELSLEERLVLAAEAQVIATRENTAMLAALLAQLTGQPSPDPRAAAAIQAQADQEPDRGTFQPLPADPTQGTTGSR